MKISELNNFRTIINCENKEEAISICNYLIINDTNNLNKWGWYEDICSLSRFNIFKVTNKNDIEETFIIPSSLFEKLFLTKEEGKFKELNNKVIQWAKERDILKIDPIRESLKTSEELLELQNAIMTNDKEEIIDAIGDITVSLIIQSEMQGLDFTDCLNSAFNVIKNRTGKIINGQFVKDK